MEDRGTCPMCPIDNQALDVSWASRLLIYTGDCMFTSIKPRTKDSDDS